MPLPSPSTPPPQPHRPNMAYCFKPAASPSDDSTQEYSGDSSEEQDDEAINLIGSWLENPDESDTRASPRMNRYLPLLLVIFLTSVIVHIVDHTMNKTPAQPKLHNSRSSSLKGAALTPATKFQVDPNPKAKWPRVAWLMSFPNSGTSYTIAMVSATSKKSTATNYGGSGVENEPDENVNCPVLHGSDGNGPFWLDPETSKPKTDEYAMTKTHCGGYCSICKPSTYVETTRSFEVACRSGTRRGEEVHNETQTEAVTYKDDVVQRAIHLIRNPFDNLVSRLHLDIEKWETKGDREGKVWNFTSDREALKVWCKQMDESHQEEEQDFRLIDNELYALGDGLPCHAEFFRYIQWHNKAIEVARNLKLPVLYLYYENYTTNFDETVGTVLDFLNLENVAPAPEFYKGKHYDHYFEPHESRMGARLIQKMATAEAWQVVKHYVEPWL
jgi:hypothetical protein